MWCFSSIAAALWVRLRANYLPFIPIWMVHCGTLHGFAPLYFIALDLQTYILLCNEYFIFPFNTALSRHFGSLVTQPPDLCNLRHVICCNHLRSYIQGDFFYLPPPLVQYQNEKKVNDPTRGSFRWWISWNSSPGWLHGIFVILVLNRYIDKSKDLGAGFIECEELCGSA